jgi:hypothetical protein
MARSVSDIGARQFENPFFDVPCIPFHFANPILSHSGGVGINAVCRAFLLVGIGTAGILSKTVGDMVDLSMNFTFAMIISLSKSARAESAALNSSSKILKNAVNWLAIIWAMAHKLFPVVRQFTIQNTKRFTEMT